MIDTGAYHASRIFYSPRTEAHATRAAAPAEIVRLYDAIGPRLTISMSPRPSRDFDGRGALWKRYESKRSYEIVFFPVRWEINRALGMRTLSLREFCEFYGLNVKPLSAQGHEDDAYRMRCLVIERQER